MKKSTNFDILNGQRLVIKYNSSNRKVLRREFYDDPSKFLLDYKPKPCIIQYDNYDKLFSKILKKDYIVNRYYENGNMQKIWSSDYCFKFDIYAKARSVMIKCLPH
jgi:hypothetical protein